MIEFVPFKADHLLDLPLYSGQEKVQAFVARPEFCEWVASAPGPKFTAIADGMIVGCAGVRTEWEGRGTAWAFIGRDAGPYWFWLHRKVRQFLAEYPLRRIEMDVDCSLPNAKRWMTMLGLTCEAERRRRYSADGRDFALYARVKE